LADFAPALGVTTMRTFAGANASMRACVEPAFQNNVVAAHGAKGCSAQPADQELLVCRL